jgi:hypothetical protein
VCEKLCREINLPVKRTVTSDQLAKAAALVRVVSCWIAVR